MAGLEKSLAVVAALSDVVDCVEKVMADGKVTLGDMKVLPSLVADLKLCVGSLQAVKDELSDLDSEEVKQLVAALVDVALKASKIE